MAFLLFLLNTTLPGALNQGDRIFYNDARSLALGGITAIIETGNSPASAGFINRLSVLISAKITSSNEKRGLRVYDSYGNNIGISTVSNNTFVNTDLAASSIILPYKFIRLGVKYSPLWDFNYSYRHEYRDDFQQITKIVENEYNGSVFSLSPLFCVNYKFISVGGEYNFLYGNRCSEIKIFRPDSPDSISMDETSFSGTTAKFEFTIHPGMHVRFSYMYSLKYKLESKASTAKLNYPDIHTVAFLYQPAARIPTKFLGEIAYERWDNSIFIYKFGVEHKVLSNFALRYGFCVFPDYEQDAIWTTILSLGFGINSGKYYFDIGYGYGKRNYSSNHYEKLGVTENMEFDESMNNFLISLGLIF